MSSTYIDRTTAYSSSQQSFGVGVVRNKVVEEKADLKKALNANTDLSKVLDVKSDAIKKDLTEPAAIFELSKESVAAQGRAENEKLQKEVVEKSEKRTEETKEKMEELGDKMNELMDMIDGNSLKFKKHDDSGEIVMVLIDKVTEEEIRQVPSELFLNIATKFKEFLDQNQSAVEKNEKAAEAFEENAEKVKDERTKAYMNFTNSSSIEGA